MSDSVFDFTKAHERIALRLRFERRLECMTVCDHLYNLGLVWDDDFGYMPRQDKIEPWQDPAICYAKFFDLDFGHVYSRPKCAGLDFEYRYSFLPLNSQTVFLTLLEQAKSIFGGQIEQHGAVLSNEQVQRFFQRCNFDLQEEFAETPGSEYLQRMLLEYRPIDWKPQ